MATSSGWGAGINFRLVPSTTLSISSVTGMRGARGEGCLPVELSVVLSRFSSCWFDGPGDDDDGEDDDGGDGEDRSGRRRRNLSQSLSLFLARRRRALLEVKS